MVESPLDSTAVVLQLNKQPDFGCYPPIKDFFAFLVKNVTGVATGSFGDVVVSSVEPSVEDLNKVWIEPNGQRNDFQLKLFINGEWRVWNFTAENEVRWFDGRAPLPSGWTSLGVLNLDALGLSFTKTANSNAPSTLTLAKWIGF